LRQRRLTASAGVACGIASATSANSCDHCTFTHGDTWLSGANAVPPTKLPRSANSAAFTLRRSLLNLRWPGGQLSLLIELFTAIRPFGLGLKWGRRPL
jgi:hypothetical protein